MTKIFFLVTRTFKIFSLYSHFSVHVAEANTKFSTFAALAKGTRTDLHLSEQKGTICKYPCKLTGSG